MSADQEIGEAVVVPDPANTVEWKGETFRIADEVGMMSRVWFAKMASDGADSDDLGAGAAMSDMLEDSLADGEYDRFRAHARKVKASTTDLLELCSLTLEALAKRPTVRPSVSSDGPSPTSQPSSDEPLQRVLSRIPATRPDLRLVVEQGHAAKVRAAAVSAASG